VLGKRFIISIGILIAGTHGAIVFSDQAPTLSGSRENPHGNILMAESWVGYPYGWFFTLEQMEELYEEEYFGNNRLNNYIKYDNGKCINQCNNELVEIPWQFIEKTLRLLEHLLDRGFAKYLFRLDTFHGHFFVTDLQFEKEYLNLNTSAMMNKFVFDDSLAVLFHCAEHMALRDPPHNGVIDKEAMQFIQRRNILGWYDNETIEIIVPGKDELVGSGKSNTATIPQGHRGVGVLTFKANDNGEFSIEHAGRTIRLDISLCDYYYY
jgi:hypothetical protein